jgi:hypothetical protein
MPKPKTPRRPGSRQPGGSGDQASAEIETQALEEARRDPRVNTFLSDVKERGETLDGKGMIHP